MTEIQTLPHSEQTEAALCARLLVDPAQLPVLAGHLAPEDFYVGLYRTAYGAMQRLASEHRTVDAVSLRERIGEDADEIGRHIGELTAAYRAPLDEYADILRGLAFRRRLIGALGSVSDRAFTVDSRDVLLSDLHEKVVGLSKGLEDGRLLSPDAAVDQYNRASDERRAGTRLAGLEYGLAPLDNLLNPAQGGEMIVIAARPSVGKTALAECIADHWAKTAPHPILFVSLEMSAEQLMHRTLSRESGVPAHDIVRGIMSETQARAVHAAVEARRNVPLWQLDNPFATTADIRSTAAKIRLLTGGISGIVVDYLQLLKDRQDLPEVGRVTGISRMLKAIAREFDSPLIALSQLNRQAADQRPRLQDLRESGAIEQDADVVLALARELGTSDTFAEVLKARQGPVGSLVLKFDHEHLRFEPWDPPAIAAAGPPREPLEPVPF